jgi:hypothetical protein
MRRTAGPEEEENRDVTAELGAPRATVRQGAPALEKLAGHVPTPDESFARERRLTPLSFISQFLSGAR